MVKYRFLESYGHKKVIENDANLVGDIGSFVWSSI